MEKPLIDLGAQYTGNCLQTARQNVSNLHWYTVDSYYCLTKSDFERLTTGLYVYDLCLSKVHNFLKALQKIEQGTGKGTAKKSTGQ